MVLVLPRRRRCAARGRAALSQAHARSARSTARSPSSSERLNGEDGLGAIFPAMANSVMMFDALGYPADHPQRAIARTVGREASGRARATRPIASPACRRSGTPALVCHALLEVGGERAVAQVERGLDWLDAAAGARRARRLDRAAARSAARRLGLPIRQSALSRRRRHRGGGHGDGPRAERSPAATDFDAAIARAREWIVGMQSRNGGWGAFDADNELLLSQQHSVRRSRRAARSADRGRDRALPVDAGAARRDARPSPAVDARASIICAARSSPTAAGTAAGA